MHFRAVRNYLILLAVVVVLVVAYTLGGFFGVPRLLRSQLQQFASEHYGRQVAVGEIRFNPYTLALEVRDFSFEDADHQPLVAFSRLFVNLGIASVWRRGASFSDIELDRPVARMVIRPDGSLNFADLARPFAATGKPPTPPPPSEPTRLFVERMRVSESALTFEDLTHATPFRAKLTPVTFELRDFSTTEKTGNAYALRGASSEGEKFSWSGSFALEPLASRGRFELENVQARTLWSYLRESLGFQVSSGIVALSGDYDFAASPQGVGLKVNVSNVDVSDLGMRPRQGDADYVHLTRLNIADTQFDLARRRVEVGKVRLAGGEVHAWREADGRINLIELMTPPAPVAPASTNTPAPAAAPPAVSASADAPASPNTTAPAARAGSQAWTVNVPDIGIEQLKVAAEDRFVKPTAAFELDPIEIHVGGFSTAPDALLDLDVSIGINRSGQLKVHGKTALGSTNFRGDIDLRGLDLTAFQPYLATYTQMTLQSGVLGTKLDVDLPADGALVLKGETDVSRLRTIDNALRQDFIKWERLQVSGIEYRAKPAGLKIASVVASTPYIRAIIAPDQTLNIAKVLSAPASAPGPVQTVRTATKEPDAVGTKQPLPMSIGSVRIANGSANFADFWITPNYAVSLQGLNGTITGLSSERKSRAKLKLEGKVDRYAPALIEGDVNLLSASLYTDLKVSFKGVDMSSVTPYSGRFAGYRIEKGKLSVDVSYHVENRQLKAAQRFVIDQLQLGERVESKDAIKLPLRLAVALLKDRNGVIDLDLPVTGSLDDPKFRIGPIIWKAVINLLGKIATAPFALLGRLFGGGEEMNLVDFEPGASALTPAGQEKMTALVKAMKERPQLQLDVPATYSPDVDKPLLAQKRLDDKLTRLAEAQGSARKRKEPEPAAQSALADPARRFDLLVAQYHVDFGADTALPPAAQEAFAAGKKKREPPMLEAANTEIAAALNEKDAVPDRELEELGEARAHAIQDALLGAGEIEATRVFLIAANAKPPAAGKVRVELSLK